MNAIAPAVLVVEDEAILLWDIAEELRDSGFTVYEARNADEAILVLQSHQDIVALFTDVDMPGSMDGIKLAHAVRDRWPPVRIIVTSGIARPEQHRLPAGGVFMPKPYHPNKVASAIRSLLHSR